MGKGAKLCAAGVAGTAAMVAYEMIYDQNGNVIDREKAKEQWPTWTEMQDAWDKQAEEWVEDNEMAKEKYI